MKFLRIVLDTSRNITDLLEIVSEKTRGNDVCAKVILDNCIAIDSSDKKIAAVVAASVAEFILRQFEREIAYEFVREFELLKPETEEILDFIAADGELREKRRNLLAKEFEKHASAGKINIDGLVLFRLSEYKEELKFAVEMFVDELSVKKSYDEFIGLMKYFTEIQKPETETVILSEDLGEYKLTDGDGNPLRLRFDEEFADELMPIGVTGDDLLISNLMAAMPKKIIFDNIDEKKPIINTISRIFEGRITY